MTAEIRGRTVGYAVDLSPPLLLVIGYLLATVGSLLLLVMGVLVAVGALVCWALWRLEFVSTWCAFAALCSVVLFGWVRARPPSSTHAPRVGSDVVGDPGPE